MVCGRWFKIGAPPGAVGGALGGAVWHRFSASALAAFAIAFVWVAIGVLTASPASAQSGNPVLDPGGPGPNEPTAAADATASPSCERSTATIGRPGTARNRLIVAVSYCAILKRPPDLDGLSYWTAELDGGMSVSELIGVLVDSPEFQARRIRTYSQTLSALRLGPARLEQRRLRELRSSIAADIQPQPEPQVPADGAVQIDEPDVVAVPDDDGSNAAVQPDEESAVDVGAYDGQRPQADLEREAQAQRQAELWAEAERRIVEEKRAVRLRVRTPITAAEFNAKIEAVGLASADPITDALIHGRLPGERQPVNVAYVHLSATRGMRVSPADRSRATVGVWASEIGAHVAINGNWYAPFDGPAVSGGTVYGGDDHFYTSLFGFTAAGDLIFDHHRETSETVDDRVVEGVSGHPTLIYRGERTSDFGGDPTFTSRQPRTAIGLDRTGDILILVTVDGRSSSAVGMTGDETARLMERLGAFDAVMLDGGGSSTMWIAGRGIVNSPSGSLRAVGNQVAVFGT